ncbi:gag/pol protein [Cucumis melo var. makuwa]|uniref:Gag/pol protein n=1 Tax=Cucumis melo var. makuwa TaxID=1194695 RepID=A0A5D3DTE0_CUCMM|nr:gag/pol protein [Cucumis melo var. makuwa]
MKLLMNQQGLLMKLVPHQELMKLPHQVVIPDDGVEDPLSYKQAMNDKDQRVKAIGLGMEPMHGVHLSTEQCPKTPQEVEDMRRIPYASAMGSLMYDMLYTRLDICYVVGIVIRYQSNPGLDH